VRLAPPRISRANLGDPEAGFEEGPAAWASSFVSGATDLDRRGAGSGPVRVACFLPLQLTPLGVRLVLLCWVLILTPTSFAAHPAESRAPFPDGADRTTSTDHAQSGSLGRSGRCGGDQVFRHHKRWHAIPRLSSSSDPYDNEASDDPDDDIVWDDREDSDDASIPFVPCLIGTANHVLSPTEIGLVPDPAEPTSSLILTTQRLRC
jgi:hypothetical protein